MQEPQPLYTQVGTSTTSIVWPESNLNSHCRVCGNVNDYLIPIFSGEGAEHQLEIKINRYLPIKVTLTDRLPTQVCYPCASTILAWNVLVENCLETEKKLYNLLPCELKTKEILDAPNKSDVLYFDDSLTIGIANDVVITNTLPVHNISIDNNFSTSKEELKKETAANNTSNNDKRNTFEIQNKPEMENGSSLNNRAKDASNIPSESEEKPQKKRRRKKRTLSTCLICGKVFNFLEYLKTHLLIHSENRPHLCHICGATFKRKDHVNHHRRTVHITHRDVIQELGAKGEEPLTCDECGDIKPTKHAMQIHKKKHNLNCVCDVCNKSFTLPSLLKDHMVKTHADDICSCNICGEVLKSGHSLYLHKKKHSTSYICDVCGKSFALPSSLRTHMVVHSEDKPFTCEECGKSFKLKGRLQLHKQSHGNIRPYACTICENKRFKTKSALIVHNNMHNDTRLYPCPHCSFRARKNSDLVCHIRTHTGEKPYKCDICGRGFAQAGDMRKHKTTHNRNKL